MASRTAQVRWPWVVAVVAGLVLVPLLVETAAYAVVPVTSRAPGPAHRAPLPGGPREPEPAPDPGLDPVPWIAGGVGAVVLVGGAIIGLSLRAGRRHG